MSEEIIENMTTDSNFASPFAGHHLLPGINFSGYYLINEISVP